MQYPPDDQSQARADASRRLTQALRDVADANERLQLAAAMVFEAFGDTVDAETVRMLLPGRRPGPPPVPAPAARSEYFTDDVELALLTPGSVTGDETGDGSGCPDCWSFAGCDDLGRCKTCGRDR